MVALAASWSPSAFTARNTAVVANMAAGTLLGCCRPTVTQTTLSTALNIKSGGGKKMPETRGECGKRNAGAWGKKSLPNNKQPARQPRLRLRLAKDAKGEGQRAKAGRQRRDSECRKANARD